MARDDYRDRLPSSTGDPVQDALHWAAIAFRGSVEAVTLVRGLELDVERLAGRVAILEQRQPSSPPDGVVVRSPNGWRTSAPGWLALVLVTLISVAVLAWSLRALWGGK